MESFIRKIPIPMSGVMLALSAAGNLVAGYGNVYRNFCGVCALFFLFLLIAKLLIDRENVLKDMQNPVIASVAPTFSMGVMILSTYIKPYLTGLALGFWFLGLLLHLGFIIYYVSKFIVDFQIKRIFPSTYVVFVGIVVGSVTAPVFNLQPVGQVLFWFGLASFIALSPIILYRLWVVKEIPDAAKPVIAIFAAPASLCLVGYLATFQDKNPIIINGLLILGIFMTVAVLVYLPKLLKLKFYPSYAAFGFPFVVSAHALGKFNELFGASQQSWVGLRYLSIFEEIFALLIVAYVIARYSVALLSSEKQPLRSQEKLSAQTE